MRRLCPLLVALAAVSIATTAQAASGPSTTIQVSTFRVLYGHPLSISGRVSTHSASVPVTILARRFGQPRPAAVATVTTGSGGYWRYRTRPSIQTLYTARLGGTMSRALSVGVQPLVTVRQLDNGRLAVQVMAGRSVTGRTVKLQQLVRGGEWRTVEQRKLAARSSDIFTTSLPTSTIRVVMSVNQAGGGYLGAMSHPLRYRAHSLTLTPSSYRILFGKAVTLSGRLVGGQAGETITILQRQFGRSAPMKLATVSTTANGEWSFRIKPVIQVSFRALWGRTEKSPLVRVGVQPNVSISELANGRVAAHIAAAVGFKGRLVKLQQRSAAGAWQTVAQKRVDFKSEVVFAKALPVSTIRVAMSVNQAGSGYLGTASHALRYRPPRLTLAVSTFAVPYGNALQLSGRVISRQAGMAIGIYARPYGMSAPHRVATVMTDSTGRWSYRARPSIQTSYSARIGSIASPLLTVGVKPAIAVKTLTNGRVVAQVRAGRSFAGRKVKLQRRLPNGTWVTMTQRPLDGRSATRFALPLASSSFRVVMSVNAAGAGFLGSMSKIVVYRGA
jgi:hypothetical protein